LLGSRQVLRLDPALIRTAEFVAEKERRPLLRFVPAEELVVRTPTGLIALSEDSLAPRWEQRLGEPCAAADVRPAGSVSPEPFEQEEARAIAEQSPDKPALWQQLNSGSVWESAAQTVAAQTFDLRPPC